MTSSAWKQPGLAAFLALVAVVVSLQLATVGSMTRHSYVLDHLGTSWEYLREFHLHRLLTSSFVQSAPGIRAGILVLVGLAALVVLRQRVSPWRALAVWFMADALSSVALFSGARLLASRSVAAANYTTKLDAGSSSGALAIITAGLLAITDPVKRALAVGVLLAIQIPYYLRAHNPAYIAHIFAITATVAIVALADQHLSRRVRSAGHVAPDRESAPTNGQYQ